MMKDEEPPKEVDKLYEYFDPKCEIAFQMLWKQTYDNCSYQMTFAFK